MTLKRIVTGALAGLTATLPMTWAMQRMHRHLPRSERYPFPQDEIVDKVVEEAGLKPEITPQQEGMLMLFAHYGYGAGAGAVYAVLTRPDAAWPVARGIAFGLLLWAGSYLGWLPALGILRSAARQPRGRNAMMIAAHAVWGAVTGALLARRP